MVLGWRSAQDHHDLFVFMLIKKCTLRSRTCMHRFVRCNSFMCRYSTFLQLGGVIFLDLAFSIRRFTQGTGFPKVESSS